MPAYMAVPGIDTFWKGYNRRRGDPHHKVRSRSFYLTCGATTHVCRFCCDGLILSIRLVEAVFAYMYGRTLSLHSCKSCPFSVEARSECSWMYVLTDVPLQFRVCHNHSSSSSVTRPCSSPSSRTAALQSRFSSLSRRGSKRRHWMPVSFRLRRQPCIGAPAVLGG